MPLVLKNEKPIKQKFKINLENKSNVHRFGSKKNNNDNAYVKKYNKIDQDGDLEADDNYGDVDNKKDSSNESSSSNNSSCESSGNDSSSSTDDDDDGDGDDNDHDHNHDGHGNNENESEIDKIVMLNTEGCIKDLKNQLKNFDQNCNMFYSNSDDNIENNIAEQDSDVDRKCNNLKLTHKEKYANQNKISFKTNHADKGHKIMEKVKSKNNTKPKKPNQKYKKYGEKHKRKKRNIYRHSKKKSYKVVKSKLCKKCVKNLLKSLTKHRRKRYVSTSSSSSSSNSSSSESSSSEPTSESSASSSSNQKKSSSKMDRKHIHSKKNFQTGNKKTGKYKDLIVKNSQKRDRITGRTNNIQHSLMDFSAIPSQRFATPIMDVTNFKDNISVTSLSHSPFTQLEYNATNYCDKQLSNIDYIRQNNGVDDGKNDDKIFEIHQLNSDFINNCENCDVTQHTGKISSNDNCNNANNTDTKETKTSPKSDDANNFEHSKSSRLFSDFRNDSVRDETSCNDHSINKVCLGRCNASCDSLSALDKITDDNHIQNTTSNVCDINIYDNEICNLVQSSVNALHDQTNDDENYFEKSNQINDDNLFENVQSDVANNSGNTPTNVPIKDWTYEYFETPNDHYSKFIFSPEAELNDNVKSCSSLSPAKLTTATDVTNATTITTAATISNTCSSSLSSPATQTTAILTTKADISSPTQLISTGNTSITTQLNACTVSNATTNNAETVSKNLIKISFNRQASKFKVLKPMAKNLDQITDTNSIVKKLTSSEEKLNDDEAAHEDLADKPTIVPEKSESETAKEPIASEDAIDKTSSDHDNSNKLYASVKPINVVKTSSNVKTMPSSSAESSVVTTVANYVDESDKISGSKKPEHSIITSKYIAKDVSKGQKVTNRRSHSNERSRRRKSRSRSPDKYRSDKRYKEHSSKPDSHSYKRNYKNYDDPGNDKSSDDEDKKIKYRRSDSDKYSRYDYSRYDKSYYSKSRNKDEKFEKSKKYDKFDKSKSPKKSSTSSSASQPAQLSASPPSSSPLNRHHYNHHEYYKYKYDKQSMRSYPSYRPYPPSVRMPPFMMPPSSYPPFMPPLLPSHPASPWTSVPDYHQRQPPPQVFLQPGSQPTQIYYEYQIQTTVADENEAANINGMNEARNEKNDDNNSNKSNKIVEQNKDAENKLVPGNS